MNLIEERAVLRSITPTNMEQKPKKAKGAKRGKPWNLRPTEELQELMEAALEATGADRTDIILKCIEKELPGIVRELLDKRKQAEQKYSQVSSKQKRLGKGESNQ